MRIILGLYLDGMGHLSTVSLILVPIRQTFENVKASWLNLRCTVLILEREGVHSRVNTIYHRTMYNI